MPLQTVHPMSHCSSEHSQAHCLVWAWEGIEVVDTCGYMIFKDAIPENHLQPKRCIRLLGQYDKTIRKPSRSTAPKHSGDAQNVEQCQSLLLPMCQLPSKVWEDHGEGPAKPVQKCQHYKKMLRSAMIMS